MSLLSSFRWLLPLFALWAGLPALASSLRYGPALDQAHWTVKRAPGRCALVQDIPRLGRARFHQASGKGFHFTLDLMSQPLHPVRAWLESVPPPWRHDALALDLGQAKVRRSRAALDIGGGAALRLYYELEKGMFPRIHYQDWADGRDEVAVTLSAVRFREVLGDFQQCLAGLIQLDFTPRAEYRIHFRTNSVFLDRRARLTLRRVVKRLRHHRGPVRLLIGGHADERGTDDYNERLALRRAVKVRNYLRQYGIASRRIQVRSYGERWPLDPRHTQAAWAKNRRATLWITD